MNKIQKEFKKIYERRRAEAHHEDIQIDKNIKIATFVKWILFLLGIVALVMYPHRDILDMDFWFRHSAK